MGLLKYISIVAITIFAVFLAGCNNNAGDPLSTEETAYISSIKENANTFGDAIFDVREMMDTPNQHDTDWQVALYRRVDDLVDSISRARTINPPRRFRGAHRNYLRGMNQYEKGLTLIPLVVENMNERDFNDMTDYMEKGDKYIEKATQKMSEVIEAATQNS